MNGQGQATQSWAGSHLTCAFRGIRPAAPRLYHRFKRPARDTNSRGRIRGTLPSCLSGFAPANYLARAHLPNLPVASPISGEVVVRERRARGHDASYHPPLSEVVPV